MVSYTYRDEFVGLGPDYIRLKFRYEVTSGATKLSDEALITRAKSYLCMVGATPEAIKINNEKDWKLPLV